jgi:hypothetical protein
MRIDGGDPRPTAHTQPAYLDLMGHNALEILIPDEFSATLNHNVECMFQDRVKGNLSIDGKLLVGKTSTESSSYVSCPVPFLYSFGDYAYTVTVSGTAGHFSYNSSVFITTPEPHVDISVTNVSLQSYRVELNLTWDSEQLLSPASGLDVKMYIWDNAARGWDSTTTILSGVENNGQADCVLLEPNAGLFLTRHLVIGVGTNESQIFSNMFIFDQDNGDGASIGFQMPRKRRFTSQTALGGQETVDPVEAPIIIGMMGHQQVSVPLNIAGSNYTAIQCLFTDPVKGTISMDASISLSSSTASCYAPFFYSFGITSMTAVAKNDIRNVTSPPVHLDILPSHPQVQVRQHFSETLGSSGYAIKLQFTWDPSVVPKAFPFLSAYIFVYDALAQGWQNGLLVSPQEISPVAGEAVIEMSDAAATAFFDNRVMFGLGYVTADVNWGIFSKIFHN